MFSYKSKHSEKEGSKKSWLNTQVIVAFIRAIARVIIEIFGR